MAHEIKADSNTYVGYNFLTSEYYVKNLETKTATKTAYEAKLVLDITAPRNVVSVEAIQALSKDYEPITSISYTLEDTGRYIKTIYFNDYKSFAIQYDEPSLYIRGSNEMWDMSSTIGVDSVALFFWQYFVYHLGLDMPQELINTIISYYKDIQKPYVYNIIEPRTQEDIEADKPLKYTNQFIINNANGMSRGEYTGIKNPDDEYSLNRYVVTKTGVDHIVETYPVYSVDKIRNKINLDKLYPEDLFLGKQIELFDTEIVDGIYEVLNVENDVEDPENPMDHPLTHLTVPAKSFFKDFIPLYNKNVLKIMPTILEVESLVITQKEDGTSESSIICTNAVPTEIFKTENNIEIFNTGVTDGIYTIKSVSENTIILDENLKSEYTPLYNKYIVKESAKKVIENSITCEEQPSADIGELLQITTENGFLSNYKVVSIEGNKIYVDKSIEEIKNATDTKVWCNAYKILYCGYENYTEVKDSRQLLSLVNNTDGTVSVSLYDEFYADDYVANMEVYIDDYKYKITKVTNPSYNASYAYTKGSIVLRPIDSDSKLKDYKYNVSEEPKYLEVRETYKLLENSFTLSAPLPLTRGDTFEIFNNSTINGEYTIDRVENNNGTYKVYVAKEKNEEPVPEITFADNDKNSGIIQTRKYSDKILLNITYSRLADRTPVGELMLDNNEQFTKYLELYSINTPTIQNYVNFNQLVTMKHYLGEGLLKEGEPTYMNCIGLYSENYKES